MYEWNDDKMYPRTMALKKKNPDLKVLLAVGGWNHENGGTSKKIEIFMPKSELRHLPITTILAKNYGQNCEKRRCA